VKQSLRAFLDYYFPPIVLHGGTWFGAGAWLVMALMNVQGDWLASGAVAASFATLGVVIMHAIHSGEVPP